MRHLWRLIIETLRNLSGNITGWQMLRVILSLTLLTAALFKVHELSTTPYLDKFPPRWVMMVFVEFEILFALWLFFVSKKLSQITWLATLGLFSLFACVTLYKALTGEVSCGCFGRVEINPWYMSIFDSAIIGLLLWFRPAEVKILMSRENWRAMLPVHFLRSESGAASLLMTRPLGTGAIWIIFCIPTVWSMINFVETDAHNALSTLGRVFEGSSGKLVVVLEPEEWVKKPCPLLNHIDIGDRLGKGEWIVLLFHHDCHDCQKAIPICKRLGNKLSNSKKTRQVALIEMPPFNHSDKSGGIEEGACVNGRLSESREWFAETPIEIRLSQGVVTHVASRDEIAVRGKVASN